MTRTPETDATFAPPVPAVMSLDELATALAAVDPSSLAFADLVRSVHVQPSVSAAWCLALMRDAGLLIDLVESHGGAPAVRASVRYVSADPRPWDTGLLHVGCGTPPLMTLPALAQELTERTRPCSCASQSLSRWWDEPSFSHGVSRQVRWVLSLPSPAVEDVVYGDVVRWLAQQPAQSENETLNAAVDDCATRYEMALAAAAPARTAVAAERRRQRFDAWRDYSVAGSVLNAVLPYDPDMQDRPGGAGYCWVAATGAAADTDLYETSVYADRNRVSSNAEYPWSPRRLVRVPLESAAAHFGIADSLVIVLIETPTEAAEADRDPAAFATSLREAIAMAAIDEDDLWSGSTTHEAFTGTHAQIRRWMAGLAAT